MDIQTMVGTLVDAKLREMTESAINHGCYSLDDWLREMVAKEVERQKALIEPKIADVVAEAAKTMILDKASNWSVTLNARTVESK